MRRLFLISFQLFFFTWLSSLVELHAQETKIEKVYVHTDRTFYFPGEQLWFKAYVTGVDHTVTDLSETLHVELISPKGDIIENGQYKIKEGATQGSFFFNSYWVGGIYTLKCYTNWMKNYGEEAIFSKKITVQKVVTPRVLMKVDFKKKAYGAGDIVEVDYELKNLKNEPIQNHPLTFNVAIKGNKIIEENSQTDQEGKCSVKFQLPKDLNSQDVVLNILNTIRGNVESISRSVPVILNKVDLQFLPEGGIFFAGVSNKLAFKCVNEFGKPADVSGVIVDTKGNEITSFTSFYDGMGSVMFQPEIGIEYEAKITKPFIGTEFIKIPKATLGSTISLSETNKSNTLLKLKSTDQQQLKMIVSDTYNQLYEAIYDLSWSAKNKIFEKEVDIISADFPSGVTSFKIEDMDGNPLAERLVFVNRDRQLFVEIETNKKEYNLREKIDVEIYTKDNLGNPVPSNLSISVADNKLINFADDRQDHILSSLLLSSELKGKIHEPIRYFDISKPKAYQALDYIMLTNGWRSYLRKPISDIQKAVFEPEQRGFIKGVVLNENDKPVKANLILFDYLNGATPFKTDEKGFFKIKSGFDEYRTVSLVAYTDDNQKIRIDDNYYKEKLLLDSSVYIGGRAAANNSNQKVYAQNVVTNQKKRQIVEVSKSTDELEKKVGLSLEEDESSLDEVVVIGYGMAQKKELTGAIVEVKSGDINNYAVTNVEEALQGVVAGVNVTRNEGTPGGNINIRIRGVNTISGNNSPLIVVNGVILGGDSSENALGSINPSEVKNIEILKEAAATAIFGSKGLNGVILISTNSSNSFNRLYKSGHVLYKQKQHFNYLIKEYQGTQAYNYTHQKKFYIPNYKDHQEAEERTDFRKTIYWNPIVQTNKEGKATLSFYAADMVTSYKITAEGIGYNGLIGRSEELISAKKIVSLDFKSPPYITLGDEMDLSVTVSNESNAPLKGNLMAFLPKSLELIDGVGGAIEIPANGFLKKNFKIRAIKSWGYNRIQFKFQGVEYSDAQRREIKILSPYFPRGVSVSDVENASFDFEIEDVLPSSIKSQFKIHINTLEDVTEGVKSLIRKPYGCFEQVGSVTYPNILAYQFMEAASIGDKRDRKNVLAFIEEGYKKMTSYELKNGGFEWFGHEPAHEALTAYGLLQFSEMKKVYDKVDNDLIDRTKDWLLSRRDSLGAFKQNKGKYGFAKGKEVITNAYIVYVLSEVIPTEDIQLEYQTAMTEALKSEDLYRLALVALASQNIGTYEEKQRILERIEDQVAKQGVENIKVESTITRSWGNNARVETISLLLQLYMKEQKPREGLMPLVNYILKSRKHGSFGSSQSTAMALKGLLAYRKVYEDKVNMEDTLRITINDKVFEKQLKDRTKQGVIKLDSIDYLFKKGKQKVKVNFQNNQSTFPFEFSVNWRAKVPFSNTKVPLGFTTSLKKNENIGVGDLVRMQVEVQNLEDKIQSMTTAIIGVPAGASVQPWQLKELLEKREVDFYEIFENYLVFYWTELGAKEQKSINLDLKAEVAGKYTAPASSLYLYYNDDQKIWEKGNFVKIKSEK